MTRILVTGATGHLGGNLVRDLLAHGHQVVALARPGSDRRGLAGLDLTVAEGDLLDAPSVRAAVDGCEWVIHAGAVYVNQSRDPDAVIRPSVEGTANVLRAAKDAGVRRVVHTSSNATIGYPRGTTPLDETHHNTDQRGSPYVAAKCESESLALRLGAELGVETVVVCPCGILGPWDFKLTPTTRAARDMGNGGPAVLDLSVTHSADVASAHRLAAERGRPGERYLAAAENLTAERVAAIVDTVTGAGSRAMRPPWAVFWLLAVAQEVASALTGRDPELTRAILRDVHGCALFYDSTKARTELGWDPRPGADAITDTIRWLAWTGQLKPAVAERVKARFPADPTWPT